MGLLEIAVLQGQAERKRILDVLRKALVDVSDNAEIVFSDSNVVTTVSGDVELKELSVDLDDGIIVRMSAALVENNDDQVVFILRDASGDYMFFSSKDDDADVTTNAIGSFCGSSVVVLDVLDGSPSFLPCPFCGDPPHCGPVTTSVLRRADNLKNDGIMVACHNDECGLFYIPFMLHEWQTRSLSASQGNVYVVEYHAGGGGSSRQLLGDYAPHFYRFETEDGVELRLFASRG